MRFSISVDWSEEYNIPDKWENVGRRVIEEHCTHKPAKRDDSNMSYEGNCDACGFCEDSAMPMMNFAYPLVITPDDDEVLEVVKRTNCSVMHNTESDEYFLVLCGGGMDLSQDIALAYHILERWIPYELAINVCTQKDLSVSGADWGILKRAMQESLKLYAGRAQEYLKRWG